jgi:hypothetical protein
MRATCPIHVILFDFLTLKVFGEEDRLSCGMLICNVAISEDSSCCKCKIYIDIFN